MPNPAIVPNTSPRASSGAATPGASPRERQRDSTDAPQRSLPIFDTFGVAVRVIDTTLDQAPAILSRLRPGQQTLTVPPNMPPDTVLRAAELEAVRVREGRYRRLALPAFAQATDLRTYLAGTALIRVLLCGECENEAVVAEHTVRALRTLYEGDVSLVYQRQQAAHLREVMPEFDDSTIGVQRIGNTVIQCADEGTLEPAFLAITTDHINGEIEIPAASRVTLRFDIHRQEPDNVCDLLMMAGTTYRLSGAPDAELATDTRAARRADVLSRALQLIAQKVPSPST